MYDVVLSVCGMNFFLPPCLACAPPWRMLPEDERRHLLDLLTLYRPVFEAVTEEQAVWAESQKRESHMNEATLAANTAAELWNAKVPVRGRFIFDLARAKKDILRAFGDWIDAQHATHKTVMESQQVRRRQIRGEHPSDCLRRLAAHRLMRAAKGDAQVLVNHYGIEDESGEPLGLPYRRASDLEEASQRMAAELRTMGNLADELIGKRHPERR